MNSLRVIFAGIVDTEDMPLDSDYILIPFVLEISGQKCAARIRLLRKRLGLSQQELARMACVSSGTIARVEREPGSVRLGDLMAICDALCQQLSCSLGYVGDQAMIRRNLRNVTPKIFGHSSEKSLEPDGYARPLRFAVALTFAGEYRDHIRKIDSAIRKRLPNSEIFFDERYEAEIAGFDADLVLQKIYHDQSELIALFFCKEYEAKEWCCKVEWRAIRDLIKTRRGRTLLPLRFDGANIHGVFSTDICPDITRRAPEDVADLIVDRLKVVRSEHPHA